MSNEARHGVIYKLTDGKLNYFGSTRNFEKRKREHKHVKYLNKILKNIHSRYDIMEEGNFTQRELLEKEKEYIKNNFCINKKKPLQHFKSSQHKYMLKWGRSYVRCEACNVDITRWNICKHEKTLKHLGNCKKQNKSVSIQANKNMTYMKAVKLYNEQEKARNPEHKYIVPAKGSDEHLNILQLYIENT